MATGTSRHLMFSKANQRSLTSSTSSATAVLLTAFDLAREAGASDVVIRRFAGLEPNAQGKLVLSFVPVEGYATVSGIEVLPQ